MNRHLELAYLGFEASDVERWQSLLTNVIGLTQNGENPNGSVGYRMDGYSQRFFLQQGDADDVVAAGFAALSGPEYHELCLHLERSGVELTPGSDDLAKDRRVKELVAFKDPFGNPLELCFSQITTPQAFRSVVAPSGFVTGDMGMGHIVFAVPDLKEGIRWYTEVLGLSLSDTGSENWGEVEPQVAFMHCNRRHHSLALVGGIQFPKRTFHVEFHVPDVDDVGFAFDRAKAAGVPITRTIGRHTDGVLSFYGLTPSGFEWEVGTGGFDVDGPNWSCKHLGGFSVWGHQAP